MRHLIVYLSCLENFTCIVLEVVLVGNKESIASKIQIIPCLTSSPTHNRSIAKGRKERAIKREIGVLFQRERETGRSSISRQKNIKEKEGKGRNKIDFFLYIL